MTKISMNRLTFLSWCVSTYVPVHRLGREPVAGQARVTELPSALVKYCLSLRFVAFSFSFLKNTIIVYKKNSVCLHNYV